jgi:hypothetical protein
MKAFRFALSTLVPFFGVSLKAENITPEYGVKSPSALRVTVVGSGFRKSGIYYIEPSVNFGQIIKEASWLRIGTGKFTITRSESAKTTKIELSKDDSDFKLKDGDIIEAKTVLSPVKAEQGAAANP